MWLYHPNPLPDELLSSWLCRIVSTLQLPLNRVVTVALDGKPIWCSDMDRHPRAADVFRMARTIGVDVEALWAATLWQPTDAGYPRGWIAPIGIYHRRRRRHGLVYCPRCLAEDPRPHYRRQWRLAFCVLCPKHEIYLEDACPHCDEPLHGHLAAGRGLPLDHCGRCENSLTSERPPTQKPTGNIRAAQAQMEALLGQKAWRGEPVENTWQLTAQLRQALCCAPTRHALADWFGKPPLPAVRCSLTQRIRHRISIMDRLATVLDDWPATLKRLVADGAVSPSRLGMPPVSLAGRQQGPGRRSKRSILSRGQIESFFRRCEDETRSLKHALAQVYALNRSYDQASRALRQHRSNSKSLAPGLPSTLRGWLGASPLQAWTPRQLERRIRSALSRCRRGHWTIGQLRRAGRRHIQHRARRVWRYALSKPRLAPHALDQRAGRIVNALTR